MKFFLISDNIDTQIGMRLSGIDGVVLHTKAEILPVIEEIRKKKDIGILLVTQKISELIPEELDNLRRSRTLPIVTVIPDRHGSTRSKDFITRYVQEAIGVKLK
ncbi:MAG: V-type ATP synthase subunit F [Thermotogae bacterium]|jgi:V/A-type H+-transporting ATPase subunit F|nr:V-type ATP synthase subunit F [Thermotogota bacterium]